MRMKTTSVRFGALAALALLSGCAAVIDQASFFPQSAEAPPTTLQAPAGYTMSDALLDLAGGAATIASHSEKSWASITFAGARHRVELLFEGAAAVEAGEGLIACLPDHEFAISGQLVAEATVIAVDHRLEEPRMRVTCEVLMLEDV